MVLEICCWWLLIGECLLLDGPLRLITSCCLCMVDDWRLMVVVVVFCERRRLLKLGGGCVLTDGL